MFEGDRTYNPMQRQTPDVLYCLVHPEKFEHPEVLLFNKELSKEIGLGLVENRKDELFLSAQYIPDNIQLYATAYSGHQFGKWSGQLGDGRAILAGEIQNTKGEKTEIQWKGAGATPYSRFADGRAVLRSSLREYLMSEAMFHLRVPTTRALSICKTGEKVIRDLMYNGHPAEEDGAVIIRTAQSFLRFGHFEILSARKQDDELKKLADFTIENYFPEIRSEGKQKYLDFLQAVCNRTLDMIVEWYRVGFVHGVMNTDNMSALGLTIDYGPFAMLEDYALDFTSNTTDLPGKRYAFGNQAHIAQWNLWQLMNAVFPLIEDEKPLEEMINYFGKHFWTKHDEMLSKKFGFEKVLSEDANFFTQWQRLMQDLSLDHTLFFTHLEKSVEEENYRFPLEEISYKLLSEKQKSDFESFIEKFRNRMKLNVGSKKDSLNLMKKNNPKFILRNYLLFECIEEIKEGKRELLNQLLDAIQHPYEGKYPELCVKRPAKYDEVPGCSMLSCSS